MNKQRGYVSIPEGVFVALFAAGVAVGVLIGVALAFGVPWALDLFTR